MDVKLVHDLCLTIEETEVECFKERNSNCRSVCKRKNRIACTVCLYLRDDGDGLSFCLDLVSVSIKKRISIDAPVSVLIDGECRSTSRYRNLRSVNILQIICLSAYCDGPVKHVTILLCSENRSGINLILRCDHNRLLLVVCTLIAHGVSAILIGSDAGDGATCHDSRKHVHLRGKRLQLCLDLGQLVV